MQSFNAPNYPTKTLQTFQLIRDINPETLTKFRQKLNEIKWGFVFTELDPSYAFSKFFETLNEIFINEIPMKKVSKTVSNMWFDGELRRLKKLKRKAYFKILKKSNVFSKTEYNKIKNHYERVIKTKKAKYYKL